jgi:hypothetical protein
VIAYLLAGVLLLFTGLPGAIAAVLVVPYAVMCAPFWSVTDEAAETANRGWRRFLWLNFVSGFVVTMLLIAYWWMTAA